MKTGARKNHPATTSVLEEEQTPNIKNILVFERRNSTPQDTGPRNKGNKRLPRMEAWP